MRRRPCAVSTTCQGRVLGSIGKPTGPVTTGCGVAVGAGSGGVFGTAGLAVGGASDGAVVTGMGGEGTGANGVSSGAACGLRAPEPGRQAVTSRASATATRAWGFTPPILACGDRRAAR